MEKYLLKLRKINQKIEDESDYYTFLQAAKIFLKNSNNHYHYKKEVVKSLEKVKNKYVLKMLYEIAAEIKTEKGFIKHRIIKKHLKSSTISSGILRYLGRYDNQHFNQKILKKLIKSRLRIDSNLFEFLRSNLSVTKSFLSIINDRLVCVQLKIMQETAVSCNLLNFVRYLGDESKLVCIQAFEAFNKFFQNIEKLDQEIRDVILIDYNLEKYVTCSDNKYYFSTCDIIGSEVNVKNFFIYGGAFFERKELFEYLNNKIANIQALNSHDLTVQFFKRYSIEPVESYDAEIDYNFNFLFSKNKNKAVCDCYEF